MKTRIIATNCPKCDSEDIKQIFGWQNIYADYKCNDCNHNFTLDKNTQKDIKHKIEAV